MEEENIPQDCPGIENKMAGKADSCQGCPNQNICSSGEARLQKMKVLKMVQEKYAEVKKIILVMSGKGGVGKSTVASFIARAIANTTDQEVGLLDIDLCGPSAGRLLNVSGDVHSSSFGFTPLLSEDGISVMSSSFLLNSKLDAIIWRGAKKTALVKQLLLNVDWGTLDYLVIDTPPGTTDEHITVVDLLSTCSQTCALLVTTPQEVALLDVRKQVNFLQKASVPIAGFVENMAGFLCHSCHTRVEIFPPSTTNTGTLTDVQPICSFPVSRDISFCASRGLNIYEHIREKTHPIWEQLRLLLGTLQVNVSEVH